MSNQAALVVTAARKRYGDMLALDGVGFEVARGQWAALVGANGAGKTTLLQAIGGRVRLDEGIVRVLGQPVSPGSRRARKLLGVVPQDLALYPALTTRENLAVFGELHGVSGHLLDERIDWALDWTGLAERAAHPVRVLSGGMQRRLNIACGVMHAPQVLLLDEPTAGVDAPSRRRIWRMLQELRGDGVAVLQSTHELSEIQATCDGVLVMRSGRVVASGSSSELLEATRASGKYCRLTLDRAPAELGFGARFQLEGATLSGTLHDVGSELVPLLQAIEASGLAVRDLHLEAPSLEQVLVHLTSAA